MSRSDAIAANSARWLKVAGGTDHGVEREDGVAMDWRVVLAGDQDYMKK